MKHFIFCLMIFLSLLPARGACETIEIVAEGVYTMGAGETMAIAEERALKNATRKAAEEAGVFVKSYSKVQNMTLADDVVEVVANHAMKITVLNKKKSAVGDLDAIKFQVQIKAVMTAEEVAANLKKVREDKGVIEAYNRLKADFDRQAEEMESLKKRLTEAHGEDKKHVLAEISNEEKRFKANLWLEKATELRYQNSEMGLKAYDKAVELNPDLVEAYIERSKLVGARSYSACDAILSNGPAECTGQRENLSKALSDVNKAITIGKGNAEAYAAMANVFNCIRYVQWRLADPRGMSPETFREINEKYASQVFEAINIAISLQPSNPEYYRQRADYFQSLRDDEDSAISDMSRAIVLCRETDCSSLSDYYEKRGRFYQDTGKTELWEKDRTAAEKIYAGGKRESKEKSANEESLMQSLQKSEYGKLKNELYAGNFMNMDEKEAERTLKELDRKISQKKGKAEDYILRADLGRGQENKLNDYSESIRLLKSGRPEGKNALLLIRVYLSKAMASEKQHDSAIKDLQEAKKLLDQHLPQAIDLLKDVNYRAIVTGPDEEGMKKVINMTRSEAEAFTWLEFTDKIVNTRAAIYEEMGLSEKAKDEYRYLCGMLKDAQACKNLERLK